MTSAFDQLRASPLWPEPHDVLRPHTAEEAAAGLQRVIAAGPEARAGYEDWLRRRRERIRMAEDEETGDPFHAGWYLPHWRLADGEFLKARRGQVNFGGKRASKSERAAWLVVNALEHLPGTVIWAFQDNMITSIATQQRLVWHYLPRRYKAMNGRSRHGYAKINYSIDGGFTEGVLVLPNKSTLYFLSYEKNPRDYQGWALGCRLTRELEEKIGQYKDEGPPLFNIGAWLDENATLEWWQTTDTRCATCQARWLWTFSTTEGMTPAIKEIVGTPAPLVTEPGEMLPPDRVHVPGCPPGHVPIVAKPKEPGVSLVYFPTIKNPFQPNYAEMKLRVTGKPVPVILQDLYGYTEDMRLKAWPRFGAWNIVKPSDLPRVGTNYHFVDPADARNWACLWVRVTPGRPAHYYIYRDWPDERTYGPWAEPGDDRHLNGKDGRAQRSLGFGYVDYKRRWLELERVRPDSADPYHHALVAEHRVAEGEWPSEVIFERFIDPRAGKDARTAAKGGTCIIDELDRPHREESTGRLLAPALHFRQAPGLSEREGINAVTNLLAWDTQQPLTRLVNEPKLYVSEECRQVIWALENYTAGEDGGCTDFADLLRYMATARLVHVDPERARLRGGSPY